MRPTPDDYMRQRWQMNNTPQWQLNLLARMPRPLAVVLIGFIVWFWEAGIAYLMTGLVMALWFVGLPLLLGVVTGRLEVAGGAFVVVFGGTGLAILVAEAFLKWYKQVDRTLPRREKKPDDGEQTE